MRSKIADRIMAKTPEETKRFVSKYGDIVVRVHQLLKEKGISQKELAAQMGKTPSEISKWLSGDHNFTLLSITKLEIELGAELIYVPKKDSFHVQHGGRVKAVAKKAQPVPNSVSFLQDHRMKTTSSNTEPIAA